MATKQDIAQIISLTKAAYPNFQVDEKLPESWMVLLGNMPGDMLKAATAACLTEPGRIFAPGVGEIRGAASKLYARAAGIPDAYEAYSESVNAPSSGRILVEKIEPAPDDVTHTWHLLYADFKWSHPLVESVARLLGWPDRFPTDMPGADRSQFVKAYDLALARMLNEAHELPLLREYVESKAEQLRDEGEQKKLFVIEQARNGLSLSAANNPDDNDPDEI